LTAGIATKVICLSEPDGNCRRNCGGFKKTGDPTRCANTGRNPNPAEHGCKTGKARHLCTGGSSLTECK
jgi:hypothetical protein